MPSSGQLKLAAGPDSITGSRDPRLGIISIKAKCYAPDINTALFAPALDIGVPILEWNPRTINRRPAGDNEGYDVVVWYEGHQDPGNADGEYFELEGTTSDDPIESHWNYQVLLKNYNGSEDPTTGRAMWPQTMQDSQGNNGRNPMHGVQSFLSPGLVWNHNWTSPTLPFSVISQLGTIGIPPGNPPALSGNRQWICTRVRGKFRANIWQNQTSWMLTGPYGIAPELYQNIGQGQ